MATAIEGPTEVKQEGFTILSDPKDAQIDIIFVHGLGGHAKRTWTYTSKSPQTPVRRSPFLSKVNKSDDLGILGSFHLSSKHKYSETGELEAANVIKSHSENEERGVEQDVFWPRDLLKSDFPVARIIMFGYNTRVTEGYQAAHQGNIFAHARNLLYGLESKRRKAVERDLVFIAHSLGGILVKEAMRRSEFDPDIKIRKIFASTTGVFFFGTPHRGSKEWASFGEGIAGVAGRLSGKDINSQIIHALLPASPELEVCRESFTAQWVARGNSLVVRTFQESKGMIGIQWKGVSSLIVPPDSSSLDHPNQRARIIDEDHVGMVKFKGPDDEAYQMIREDIKELIENCREATVSNINEEDRICIQHLRPTDPRDDKRRIEETKGGLLEHPCRWIYETSDYQKWRGDQQSRLLWIKGDPGKGKTMLLSDIINQLERSKAELDILSYFFCQATDPRINNATAVLRGLLYMLVAQQPSLIPCIRKRYNHAGKALFEDINAWTALSEIFTNVLQDPDLKKAYFIIDALDECVTDLPRLLNLILQESSRPNTKWIVSSRYSIDIERILQPGLSRAMLDLEQGENAQKISDAVNAYIGHCIRDLAVKKKYNEVLETQALDKMRRKANDTFLWVSLVTKQLDKVLNCEVLQVIDEMPSELANMYKNMLRQIKEQGRQYPEYCRLVLSTATAAYRPLHLDELGVLSDLPKHIQAEKSTIAQIVKMCSSFLTIRDEYVYIIHQSVMDFLTKDGLDSIFPSGIIDLHYKMYSVSMQVMSTILRRDMYDLNDPTISNDQIERPWPDPLTAARYACDYWIDHLCDASSKTANNDAAPNLDAVDSFMREQYLYWLEALSLYGTISDGVVSIGRLETLIQQREDVSALIDIVHDAWRFIMYHKQGIEDFPLQIYESALVFSPPRSLVKRLFEKEHPKNLKITSGLREDWGKCLLTLGGHNCKICSVASSYDSKLLASASSDGLVKIWDSNSGHCLQSLRCSELYGSIIFSQDSKQLALLTGMSDWESDKTSVNIWDISSGESLCMGTFQHCCTGPHYAVSCLSYDLTRLAYACHDCDVHISELSSGKTLQKLKSHGLAIEALAFSHDSTRLASISIDGRINVWDTSRGKCLRRLEVNQYPMSLAVFSDNLNLLATTDHFETVHIWDVTSSMHLWVLSSDNCGPIRGMAFSHDSLQLFSAAHRKSINIWDMRSGQFLLSLECHTRSMESMAFLYNSTRLVSAADNHKVTIWDMSNIHSPKKLQGHSDLVDNLTFSSNLTQLASKSASLVKILDVSNGNCLKSLGTDMESLKLEDDRLTAFSHDLTLLALEKLRQIEIWNTSSGKCVQKLLSDSWLSQLLFSHDAIWLASVGSVSRVWDIRSGECLLKLDSGAYFAAFSCNSTWLALSYENRVEIWDITSREIVRTLATWCRSLAFSYDSNRLALSVYSDTIEIWDISRGICLQELEVGRRFKHMSFDSTGAFLKTNRGTIIVNASSISNTVPIVTELQDIRYHGTGLSLDGEWITYGSEKKLWLPSEYRLGWEECSAVAGNMLAVATENGRVWIYKAQQEFT